MPHSRATQASPSIARESRESSPPTIPVKPNPARLDAHSSQENVQNESLRRSLDEFNTWLLGGHEPQGNFDLFSHFGGRRRTKTRLDGPTVAGLGSLSRPLSDNQKKCSESDP